MRPLFFVLALVWTGSSTKVGLLFMHGLSASFDDTESLNFQSYVEKNNSNVKVHLINAYNGYGSIAPLKKQVDETLKKVKEIAKNYDKIIAVGHSQGGVIWRGMIENWDDHNVDTFITLASPQHGVATFPKEFVDDNLDNFIDEVFALLPDKIEDSRLIQFIKKEVKFIFHGLLELGREELTLDKIIALKSHHIIPNFMDLLVNRILSFAPLNYFVDSSHYEMYEKNINYFPDLNNEKHLYPWQFIKKSEAKKRKANFTRLRKLILIGGPQDGVVVPWQSELFGYFDQKGYTSDGKNILDMEETRYYKEDLFGLKTMDEDKKIKRHQVNNVTHVEFHFHKTVMDSYVLPAVNETVNLKIAEN